MVSKSKTKLKKIESIKQELLNSLRKNDDVEGQGLNKTANNVSNVLGSNSYNPRGNCQNGKQKSNRVYW